MNTNYSIIYYFYKWAQIFTCETQELLNPAVVFFRLLCFITVRTFPWLAFLEVECRRAAQSVWSWYKLLDFRWSCFRFLFIGPDVKNLIWWYYKRLFFFRSSLRSWKKCRWWNNLLSFFTLEYVQFLECWAWFSSSAIRVCSMRSASSSLVASKRR